MIKDLINRLFKRTSSSLDASNNPSAKSIARWQIGQVCTCPHCSIEFDIIKANLARKTNQGTIKISQKVVSKYNKDKFEYVETTTEIPRPPYFGVMNEDCENIEEYIRCVECNGLIEINQVLWEYV